MAKIVEMRDGLMSLFSSKKIGKSSSSAYIAPRPDPIGLMNAYRASGLCRRAVDLPAEDSVREWREWQAQAADITKIEAEEKRLKLASKVFEARQSARMIGGGAILIGVQTETPEEPIDLDSIGTGDLEYLTVLGPDELSAGELDRDPRSPTYGQPSVWRIASPDGEHVDIHPSRLAFFHGIRVIGKAQQATMGYWGDSILGSMLDALKRVDQSAEYVSDLIAEAKIDVIGINNFMEDLRNIGPEYEEAVRKRVELVNNMKGTQATIVIDKDDTWEQKTASFGGLPEVLAQFMTIAATHAGIPMTLLFEVSPTGLNNNGSGDLRNYYDRVKVLQTLHMSPAMEILDEVLIRSSLGSRDEDIHYNWRPLWQPSDKEKAENADKRMSALERLDKLQTIPREPLGKAAVNALTESGAFPGLEQAVADYYEEHPEEEGEPQGEDRPSEEDLPRPQSEEQPKEGDDD